jgi:hypothetical protein
MVEISRALEEKVHSGSEEAILEESTSEWQESREFKPLAPRLLHHVRKTSFSNLRRSQVPQVFLKLSIFFIAALCIYAMQEFIFFLKVDMRIITHFRQSQNFTFQINV